MKGLEKLTSIRLAEVLTQKNVVPTDAITDALYTHEQCKEPFVDVLVSTGHITEWDLAKVVVEHFQLPFIMASNYDIDTEVQSKLPTEVLYQNLLVPLDVFEDAVSVAMPILTTHEVLQKIQREHSCEIYPYVGLISENKKVLSDMFSDFKEWHAEHQERQTKQRRSASAKGKQEGGGDWENIFDSADAAVRDSLR